MVVFEGISVYIQNDKYCWFCVAEEQKQQREKRNWFVYSQKNVEVRLL